MLLFAFSIGIGCILAVVDYNSQMMTTCTPLNITVSIANIIWDVRTPLSEINVPIEESDLHDQSRIDSRLKEFPIGVTNQCWSYRAGRDTVNKLHWNAKISTTTVIGFEIASIVPCILGVGATLAGASIELYKLYRFKKEREETLL
jgi:hypothetical protein